jgi:hypothetical protein
MGRPSLAKVADPRAGPFDTQQHCLDGLGTGRVVGDPSRYTSSTVECGGSVEISTRVGRPSRYTAADRSAMPSGNRLTPPSSRVQPSSPRTLHNQPNTWGQNLRRQAGPNYLTIPKLFDQLGGAGDVANLTAL